MFSLVCKVQYNGKWKTRSTKASKKGMQIINMGKKTVEQVPIGGDQTLLIVINVALRLILAMGE